MHPTQKPKIRFFQEHGITDKMYSKFINRAKESSDVKELSTIIVEHFGYSIYISFLHFLCLDIATNQSRILNSYITEIVNMIGNWDCKFITIISKKKLIPNPDSITMNSEFAKAKAKAEENSRKSFEKSMKETEEWNRNTQLEYSKNKALGII